MLTAPPQPPPQTRRDEHCATPTGVMLTAPGTDPAGRSATGCFEASNRNRRGTPTRAPNWLSSVLVAGTEDDEITERDAGQPDVGSGDGF